jgi:hypothetical protein
MIIFGYNNFKIKTIKSSELTYSSEYGKEDIEIEVYQKYVHIFWIPFFPIGRIWGFKKKNDPKLYEIPDSLNVLIPNDIEIKTPWYSFAILFITPLIFLGVFASEQLSQISNTNYQYKKYAKYKMYVKYPITGDFYNFRINSKTIVLKVNSYTNNSIEFVSRIRKNNESEGYISTKNEIQKMDAYTQNPIIIPKTDLINLIQSTSENSYAKESVFVPVFGQYCALFEIVRDKNLIPLN